MTPAEIELLVEGIAARVNARPNVQLSPEVREALRGVREQWFSLYTGAGGSVLEIINDNAGLTLRFVREGQNLQTVRLEYR